MSSAIENAYKEECSRAELMGCPPPTYEEFIHNYKPEEQQQTGGGQDVPEEDTELETEVQGEQIGGISGHLDEINNILESTHRKIHRFRDSYGSFTSMIRKQFNQRFSFRNSQDEADNNGEGKGAVAQKSQSFDEATPSTHLGSTSTVREAGASVESTPRQSDLSRALDSHNDKLDAMVDKAEQAQYSMQYQRGEMRKCMK